MKKLFRTMPAVVLAVLLTGCGQGTQETMNAGYEETANAETEAAREAEQVQPGKRRMPEQNLLARMKPRLRGGTRAPGQLQAATL